jgi:hypothetical protein
MKEKQEDGELFKRPDDALNRSVEKRNRKTTKKPT